MALGDIVAQLSDQARTDAATHDQNAHQHTDQAVAATDTPANQCREGMNQLDQAWQEVALTDEAAGRANALDVLSHDPAFALLTPLQLGALSLAQIQQKTHDNATQASQSATDARNYVQGHENTVLQAYAACINNSALQCINTSLAALHTAAELVADPGHMVGPTDLQSLVVNTLIPRAGAIMPAGDCNAGLNILAQANHLVNTAQNVINQLNDCITQAMAGGIPIDPTWTQRRDAAQNKTSAARNALSDPGNASVMNVWNRRSSCMTIKRRIKAHLMDESGDDMGEDVTVSVDNIVLQAVAGGLFPTISGVSHCEGSTNFVTLLDVPVGGDPSVPLPVEAPPPPPGVPTTLPSTSVLSFTYDGTHGIQPTNVSSGTANDFRIDVHLSDVSSNTSC